MSSDVEICNMAIRHAGLKTIVDPTNLVSQEARDCARFYPQVRDEMLAGKYDWSFCKQKRLMALMTVPDVYEGQFAYGYVQPSQCLRLRGIYATGDAETIYDYDTWRTDSNDFLILTDAIGAIAHYTMVLPTSDWLTPAFVKALSYKLAAQLNILSLDLPRSDINEAKYVEALAQAKVDDRSSVNPTPKPYACSWLDARGA